MTRPGADPAPAAAWPAVVVSVVGPTASGKSAVALALAELIGAEIVSADAFQLYRGMDIGTAKPTPNDRRRVPHHGLDLLEVTEQMSVAQYQQLGRGILADLAGRGVPAVVVGGSGLYVRALLDDLHFPGSDPAVRARWQAQLDERGPEHLHAVLRERDPEAARRILPTNGRRIVRALEVGELTGSRFPAHLPADGPALVPHLSVGLQIDRPALDRRIAERVEAMFAEGLVAEVRRLLGLGLREARTASRALGYPQVIALLDGRIDQDRALAEISAATRSYARRQQRWFRRDPRTLWLPATADPLSTAELIRDRLGGSGRTLCP